MSTDIKCRNLVKRIREDVCKDCKERCGLCNHGVCQNVVIEIGAFILYCAEREEEEEKE